MSNLTTHQTGRGQNFQFIFSAWSTQHISLEERNEKSKGFSFFGEHITDTYITETDTTELENLSHNIIDIFIIET